MVRLPIFLAAGPADLFAVSGEPPGPLIRIEGDSYAPNNPNSARANATLLSLVRNSELEDMIQSMRDLERTFNHKFNYPWLFLNDQPFTEEFKRRISAETKARVDFGMAQSCGHSEYLLT